MNDVIKHSTLPARQFGEDVASKCPLQTAGGYFIKCHRSRGSWKSWRVIDWSREKGMAFDVKKSQHAEYGVLTKLLLRVVITRITSVIIFWPRIIFGLVVKEWFMRNLHEMNTGIMPDRMCVHRSSYLPGAVITA